MPSNDIPEGRPGAATSALIVEDNAIIAMEMESHLEDLGIGHCLIAGSVESALATLAVRDVAFGLIDVDLGMGVTSETVAAALQDKGRPFVFVTGYGEDARMPERFAAVPVLTKPFTAETLRRALAQIGVV